MRSIEMVGGVARNWWLWLIGGIAAVLFGTLALRWPGGRLVFVGLLFGAYAVVDGILAILATIGAAETRRNNVLRSPGHVTGVLEIVAAIHLRSHLTNEFWLIAAGVASILFGALMISYPLAGALALVWVISAYAIVFGIVMIAFSLRLRGDCAALTGGSTR